jgi:modulator of FtsH protease HflC
VRTALQVSIIVVVVAVLLVLSGTFYTVEEGQQAVIVQFGRPVGETVTEAGLHVKLPFVQGVRRFEKRLLTWDGDPNQIPTKGREFIWVDTTARWRIADAKKFLESVASEAGAQSRLDDIIDSVVRDQVSSSELIELVRSASWEVPAEREAEIKKEVAAEREEEIKKEVTRGREEITRTILAEARKIIPQYGIELVDVRIKRLDYIESVRERVYARMISERKRIAAQFRSEGEGRSAEILGAMEKELRQIRSTAYRQVQELRGGADAEATRIYGEVYSRDPEFYAFSRTLELYGEGGNKHAVLILTTDSDYYRYLKHAAPAGEERRPAVGPQNVKRP